MAGERLVSRLESLVERVEAVISTSPSDSSINEVVNERNNVESQMKRLYPSTRGNNQMQSSSNGAATNKAPSTKDLWAPLNKKKRRQPTTAETSNPKRANRRNTVPSSTEPTEKPKKVLDVLKDVFFIPNPSIDEVPRRNGRQLYYLKNLVGTAVNFNSEMDEIDIIEAVKMSIPRFDADDFPPFVFVRPVDDLLLDVNGISWSYKTIRHVYGQGPVYVRATENLFIFEDEDSMDEEDLEIILKKPVFTKKKSRPLNSEMVEEERNEVTQKKSAVQAEQASSSRQKQSSIDKYFGVTSYLSSGITCPICDKEYPANEIEIHASNCNFNSDGFDIMEVENPMDETIPFEGFLGQTDPPAADDDEVDIEDKIKNLLNEQKRQGIHILRLRRKHAWADCVNALEKHWMKKTDNVLIQYTDDSCVDDGGPRRDFFSTALKQMQQSILCNGTPIASTMFLDKKLFYHAGWLVTMSFLQEGPSPVIFSHTTYKFISSKSELRPSDYPLSEEFKGSEIYIKLSSVSTDAEFQEVLQEDEVLDVLSKIGYRGVPSRASLSERSLIIQSIYHKECIEPILPALHQLADGMKFGGLIDLVKENALKMKCYFVYDSSNKICDNQIYDLLKPNYTSENLVKSEKETEIFKHLVDTLEYIYKSDCEVALEDVLHFLTGAYSMPALGFEKKIDVFFKHYCPGKCGCRPTASTCGLTLNLPLHYKDDAHFQVDFIDSIRECRGFGRV